MIRAAESKPTIGRPRNPESPKFIQLRLPRELHREMKAEAAADALELTGWIRFVCKQELRRRKKASR